MENLSYTSSAYPDPGDSSSHGSRDADIEDSPPPQHTACSKVKFLCSYGGKIQPRPHDNQLSYVGGDTKILALDRATARFPLIVSTLASLCGDADVSCFKYQLPGEDLDALVSVTSDEDLDHLMVEYDRLLKASSKPARLRLFVFPSKPRPNSELGLGEVKSDRQWFVDALNSPPPPPPCGPATNPDFLFGLEKEDPQVINPNPNPYYNPEKVEEIPVQAGYFPERHVGGEPFYLIPAASTAGIYQAQGVPVTGQIGHPGYYGFYNVVPGLVQVGVDSAGRQVYYTAVVDGAAPTQSSPV